VLGRREIIESLDTKNAEEAKRLGTSAAARAQALIDGAGGRKDATSVPPAQREGPAPAILLPCPPALTLAEAEAIALRYRDGAIEEIIERFTSSPRDWTAEKVAWKVSYVQQSRQAYIDNLIDGAVTNTMAELAMDLLKENGRDDPAANEVRRLQHFLLRAFVECCDCELAFLQGEWPQLGTAILKPSLWPPAPPPDRGYRFC
jgi:hypothetical protein